VTLQTQQQETVGQGENAALVLTVVAMCMASLSFVYGFQRLAADHSHFSMVYAMLERKLRAKICEMSVDPGVRSDIIVQRCIEEWYQLEQIAPIVT
jgi:hypothetical protein